MTQIEPHMILRRVRFTPYVRGAGPTFALLMWDSGRRDWRGTTTIGYRLTMKEPGHARITVFEGADFNPSPMDADDSDATIEGLMGFLTIRRGDTDADYFEGETPVQAAFRDNCAEALAADVAFRFGQDVDAIEARRAARRRKAG